MFLDKKQIMLPKLLAELLNLIAMQFSKKIASLWHTKSIMVP